MAFGQHIFLTCFVLCLVQETHLTTYSSVHQESSFISAHIGDKVTLQCFYEGDDSAWICWYKQTLGQEPKLISSFYVYGTKKTFYNEFKNNPRFHLGIENHTYYLTVLDLHISDSATYYCAVNFAKVLTFAEGTTVIVKGSGSNIQALVNQPKYESIQPEGSVTLNCTIETGSCDGELSVYWFKNSDGSQPGLIYGHGIKNDQCEMNSYRQTCVFNLSMKNLDASHVGTYYCAVASCGHIIFGNGTMLNFSGEPNMLLYLFVGSLFGSLITLLVVLLIVFVNKKKERKGYQATESRLPAATGTTTTEDNCRDMDNLHYASINVEPANRSRKQRKSPQNDCVYSSISHEK